MFIPHTRRLIDAVTMHEAQGVHIESVPDNPVINNLDSLLADIYLRFIALRADDFKLYYKIFDSIFSAIHRNMKEVDPYFNRYSSTAQPAGSHYDGLRIKKPDEFDMDIVIGLPINMKEDRFIPSNSDIVLEPSNYAYVKLKMGKQFQNLPNRDEWEINKTAYKWKDENNYLLRSKFSDWFKSVVYRALNKFECYGNYRLVTVDNVPYVIRTSESGPAITLKITNITGFKMDVDLVPALRFPEERWPVTSDYRDITADCSVGSYGWMVVYNFKQTLRFIKKLRDAQGMDEIASYYIKTLFFWEVVERKSEPRFWNKPPSELFIIMVKRLHRAMANRNIPYFWNKQYNLIEGVASNILAGYANKLQRLVNILDDPTKYKMVAEYLLTDDEYEAYKPKLYPRQFAISNI